MVNPMAMMATMMGGMNGKGGDGEGVNIMEAMDKINKIVSSPEFKEKIESAKLSVEKAEIMTDLYLGKFNDEGEQIEEGDRDKLFGALNTILKNQNTILKNQEEIIMKLDMLKINK